MFFGEADLGGNFRKQSPKTLGNVPEFFSNRLSLGENFRSSPQKHSGTFPNFFRGGRLWGKSSEAIPKTLGNVPECFWGLLPKVSPKVCLPEKNSGTFPSVFGDCFRKFPPKLAYPKKIRERSRVFLGTASENFPQPKGPNHTKNSIDSKLLFHNKFGMPTKMLL